MVARFALVALALLGWSQAYFAGRCAAAETGVPYAISGRIVTEDGARRGWVVVNRNDGSIMDICDRESEVPPSAIRIRHEGYIFPGLIDTHNHCHWNSIPMWRSGKLYENRYEWREGEEYDEEVKAARRAIIDAGLDSRSLKYGEIRALVGGTTMLQGSEVPAPYLVRNLDESPWRAYSYVEDVTQAPPYYILQARMGLQYGIINRLFLHVAEGKSTDPRTQAEFPFVEAVGLTMPGVVIIHGVALTPANFQTMAQNNMYLVWSPKTNLVLYGETADVVTALGAGVTVALGPDWTISGSDNLLEELKVAHEYSAKHLGGAITPRQLFKMATSDAAKVAGVGSMLGRIAEGYQADLFLAPRLGPDPFLSLLKTYSKDIELVLIDGKPLYGKRQLMRDLVDPAELDVITVSHKKKAIDLIEPGLGPFGLERYDELIDALEAAIEIAPLIEDEPEGHPGYPRRLP
ncbi:MAG: amidohydrolase family protein [Candidatus Brocadiae bacterium]|nr:amidohydrolase family protein [Candidatus Brocadiia bacterium]